MIAGNSLQALRPGNHWIMLELLHSKLLQEYIQLYLSFIHTQLNELLFKLLQKHMISIGYLKPKNANIFCQGS